MADVSVLQRQTSMSIRGLRVKTAWPTLLLMIAIILAYWGVLSFAAARSVPLWVALSVNTLLAYAAYTPLHEAVHGNVAKGDFLWLNRLVGVASASLLLHNFTMHKTTHLSHHANLNDPQKDADHWVAGQNWWSVLFRCATLFGAHYRMGLRLNRHRRDVIFAAMAENLIPIAAVLSVGIFAGWDIALIAMIIPAVLGATILGLMFDYAVHAPYQGSDQFETTRIFEFSPGLAKLGSMLWMAQNYHLIHHLYPGLPFYRYAAAYRIAKPLLTANRAQVVRIG
jgi:beta-carotene hydroxylase